MVYTIVATYIFVYVVSCRRVIVYFMFCLLCHLCGSFFRYIFPGIVIIRIGRSVISFRCMFG